MALQVSSPSIHSDHMDERARITDEIARIKKTLLLKGFAIKPDHPEEPPVPLDDIKVQGRWDGIVGHPVEVKIIILV